MQTTLGLCLIAMVLVAATGGTSPCAADGGGDAANPRVVQLGDVRVELARWFNGKEGAISTCFEGSQASHVQTVVPYVHGSDRKCDVPVLTFLVDDRSEAYAACRDGWQKLVDGGRHELLEVHGAADIEARYGAVSPTSLLRVGTDPAMCDISTPEALQEKVDAGCEKGDWLCLKFGDVGEGGGTGIGKDTFEKMMSYMLNRRYRWQAWIGGMTQVHKYQVERDAARISAEMVEPERLRIELDCGTDPQVYDQPLTIFLEPGRHWAHYDLICTDAQGNKLPVLRWSGDGCGWRFMFVAVPPVDATYYVQSAASVKYAPEAFRPVPSQLTRRWFPALPDAEEAGWVVQDPASGLGAQICRWYDGRKSAVTFQFDGAYTTQVTVLAPLMRDEYNLRGTFVIVIGTDGLIPQEDEKWEALCREGYHELGIYQCGGGTTDEEVDAWLGAVCRYIRERRPPGRTRLVALANGGSQLLRFANSWACLLERNDIWEQHWMSSMAECYNTQGNMVERYAGMLDSNIALGAWSTSHYHGVGDTRLNITEPTFRAAMQATKERVEGGELWNATMTDVYMYEQERLASRLAVKEASADAVTLQLICATDPELFNQPLTIELALPEGWLAESVKVRDGKAEVIATRAATVEEKTVVRFDAAPTSGQYIISRQ